MMSILILIKWICAHLLGDFVLQSRRMVQHKRLHKAGSYWLWLHCIIHGLLIYLFTGYWLNWWLPLIIAGSHFFIDWWKLNRTDNTTYFVADQLLHIIVLFILWINLTSGWQVSLIYFTDLFSNPAIWLVVSGYIAVIWPSSLLIGYITQRWRNEIESLHPQEIPSLNEAGKWIGILERVLVLTFILINHFEGIGFLIAAKSILRFNDLKGINQRKETEYVLIGTLLSFAVAMLLGMGLRQSGLL